MANNLKHFAVHAGDVARARNFYEQAFGWQFTAWGPPGFFLIKTGTDDDAGIGGALQGRREVAFCDGAHSKVSRGKAIMMTY
ncbi:MAG TPA: VOC family protein [Pyrinomonadaceae bacterium]|nr:VOC family protein [Pyrinomonadaceae bacterium]